MWKNRMNAAGSVLIVLLISATAALAQPSRRRCEACDANGFQVGFRSVLREDRPGRILFYFRNTGQFKWKVESVRCEFYSRENSHIVGQSFYMSGFEVFNRTSSAQGPERELRPFPVGTKAECWIESAQRF